MRRMAIHMDYNRICFCVLKTSLSDLLSIMYILSLLIIYELCEPIKTALPFCNMRVWCPENYTMYMCRVY